MKYVHFVVEAVRQKWNIWTCWKKLSKKWQFGGNFLCANEKQLMERNDLMLQAKARIYKHY